MIRIVDEKEEKSFEDIKAEYEGCIVLVQVKEMNRGTVYAYSDWNDIGKLTNLQIEMHKKGIELTKIRKSDTTHFSVFENN